MVRASCAISGSRETPAAERGAEAVVMGLLTEAVAGRDDEAVHRAVDARERRDRRAEVEHVRPLQVGVEILLRRPPLEDTDAAGVVGIWAHRVVEATCLSPS